MAIKCHSGFVHYNMFHNSHCHGGGNNYGSIFNITNNCSGGTNFWGGLGAGLGFGLGNMFGGFFGNMFGGFGNMFGGFGMGNMFGMGGFGGFGGFGMGMGGWPWGGGSSNNDSDYSKYSSNRSSSNCGCKGKSDDKDYPEINKFDTEANDLLKAEKSADNDKKIDALVAKIKDYKLKLDDAHKLDNETQIDNLIKRLNNHRLVPVKDGENDKKVGDDNKNVPDDEIVIGGKNIKLNTIKSIEDIKNWTPEEIDAIGKDKAKTILTTLGYVDEKGVGKMSANYKVLLLLQESEVNVQCATNPNSKDQWVQGKISNVAENDGKLSYTIDNGTAEGDFKFKYSFKQVDDKDGKKCFHLTKIDRNSSEKTGYVENDWKEKDYIFQDEKSPLKTSGNPLVSSRNNTNRIKLETILE